MRLLIPLLLLGHGLIHLMGFAKAFGYAELAQLRPIARPEGLLWLACALLFALAAALLLVRQPFWWWPASAALVLSQGLILANWHEARFGSLANLLLLLPVLAAALAALPSSYGNTFRAAAARTLARREATPLVTAADLEHLPAPVRKYLELCGVVGRPRVRNFRAVFTGEFRNGVNGPWMPFRSEQVNGCDQPERFFLMDARLHGLPVQGLHQFDAAGASMRIKVAGLVQVVDATGPRMDQGETVTLFNDLCLLAPAALVDQGRIRWEPLGPLAARARFSHRGVTISATLTFNPAGDLVDFSSGDRFLSADGRTYENHPWSTPVSAYQDLGGRRVMSYGEAVWQLPGGPFCYGRFHLQRIDYNLTETAWAELRKSD